MKKIITLSLVAFAFSANAQSLNNGAEISPFAASTPVTTEVQTPWQVLFNYDLKAITGNNARAGVCISPQGDYWVSRWSNDSLFRISIAGALIEGFKIAGLGTSTNGVRAMTTDGTHIYASTNNKNIYKIDPATKTLVQTIVTQLPGSDNVRGLGYDPSGGGSFWVSNFATDIYHVDMNGSILGTISASTHGLTAMYGITYDGVSPGGPYIWSFNQSGTSYMQIIINDATTGQQIAVTHDVMSDVGTQAGLTLYDPSAGSGSLAGGIFFQATPSPIVVGVVQGDPTNRLFGYDVNGAITAGIMQHNDFSNSFISIYPNPAVDNVNIAFDKNDNVPAKLQITDVLGRVVFDRETMGKNNIINTSSLMPGVYSVKAEYKGASYTTKLIKQ